MSYSKCRVCREPAIIDLPRHNANFCAEHLVQLCRHHHRMVHEGGFQCTRDDNGNLQFRDPRRQLLNRYALPTPLPDDATIEDWRVSHMQDVVIDDTTCVPNRMAGDTMDWDLAVGNLFLA